MSGRRIISTKEIAERLCLAKIDLPGGYVLKGTSLKIDTPPGARACITAEFILFSPEPAPAVETRPGESTCGYVVPPELADAVRTGLQIIGQPVAVPLEPELSEWIDGSVSPTIVGVYQRRFSPWFSTDPSYLYSYWTGAEWRDEGKTVADALARDTPSKVLRPWRGLRHDPTWGTGA